MRFSHIMAATVGMLVASWPSFAFGSVVVSLNNPGSTTLHEIWVAPGETFSVDLNLSTDNANELVSVLSFVLQASSSNVFDVTAVHDNAPWWSSTASTIVGGVDNVSGTGYFSFGQGSQFGLGLTTLASAHIAVDPASSYGLHYLDAAQVWWSTSPYGTYQTGQAGPSLLVHIAPEPATLLLLLMATGMFFRRPH